MASLIIATVPVHGHVTPLLAVARYFTQRGDRVRFITGSRFAEVVEAAGAEHIALPAEADFDDRQDFGVTFPERTALKGAKAIAFDLENVFVRPGRAHYKVIEAAQSAEPADVVITEPAFLGGAFLVCRPLGERPPVVVCGVLPLPISSRDTAPYGMGLTPLRGPLGRLRNALLTNIAARTVFTAAERLAQEINHELNGSPLPFPIMDWLRHAEAIVQFTVPEFEYPRSDAPATLHFAGPISASGSQAPLPSWWDELDGSRPVVHVTQGTVANHDYRQIIEPSLAALADDDVLVVVSTGGRPLSTLPPLPSNARAAEYLPYDELLPKTQVYVTNGGYGGVQYALRHGVPIVTSGGKEDKPEVAGRVVWSGVGRALRTETPSPAAVGRAVRAVLGDPRYRVRARRIAASMERAGGLSRLAEIVDRQLSGRRS
ncbi:UDP:flavonoid glycosyltransferase YjiC (YdhE family) [Lentzea atacamensis]|uniref:UDP:flavonoid glycosyltransferase YjiC (YdhE family) n=1 Tax=Lentzea atacamensis TaxID=531938 RepID=A0ABX9EJQ0_9PSEU|nr:nucleotide disphospho-sugar-binding domain-containing protein [Lentzea atacamensis]RAS71435.1 UDP:flavonoid glycosyltransferase YjiC (YdhE family) [Lentzea atacamensis]